MEIQGGTAVPTLLWFMRCWNSSEIGMDLKDKVLFYGVFAVVVFVFIFNLVTGNMSFEASGGGK